MDENAIIQLFAESKQGGGGGEHNNTLLFNRLKHTFLFYLRVESFTFLLSLIKNDYKVAQASLELYF